MSTQFNLQELLSDLIDYITKVPNGCKQIAQQLRDNEIAVAATEISNLSEGIQWIISAANYLTSQEINTYIKEEDVVGFLVEINEALTDQDFYLTADLLDYEIAPYFEVIIKKLTNGENFSESN